MSQAQQVDISTLPYEQLVMLKNQFEQEVQGLAQASNTLRAGASRFQNSCRALDGLKTFRAGKDVLVPLTDSLYAPGVLSDHDHVLVDVGTGYFIEKGVADAADYFGRKLGVIGAKIAEAEAELGRKRDGLVTIQHLIQKRKADADRQATS